MAKAQLGACRTLERRAILGMSRCRRVMASVAGPALRLVRGPGIRDHRQLSDEVGAELLDEVRIGSLDDDVAGSGPSTGVRELHLERKPGQADRIVSDRWQGDRGRDGQHHGCRSARDGARCRRPIGGSIGRTAAAVERSVRAASLGAALGVRLHRSSL